MKKSIFVLFCVGFLSLPLSGCMTLQHTVGNGGTDTTQVASDRQWYILWGLVPLNNVDGGKLAKANNVNNNYTVKSQISFVDGLLNILTGLVTVYGQTVSVTK